jgi:hypothetical protein
MRRFRASFSEIDSHLCDNHGLAFRVNDPPWLGGQVLRYRYRRPSAGRQISPREPCIRPDSTGGLDLVADGLTGYFSKEAGLESIKKFGRRHPVAATHTANFDKADVRLRDFVADKGDEIRLCGPVLTSVQSGGQPGAQDR